MGRERRLFHLLHGALLLGVMVSLAGCLDAETRGGEPVDEVIVGSPPTWANGIGELMELKCGTCHRAPAGEFSPSNVPANLDLNNQTSTSVGVRGAEDILTFIDAGILTGSGGTRQMPLDYATPLTTQEIDALKTWSAGGGG